VDRRIVALIFFLDELVMMIRLFFHTRLLLALSNVTSELRLDKPPTCRSTPSDVNKRCHNNHIWISRTKTKEQFCEKDHSKKISDEFLEKNSLFDYPWLSSSPDRCFCLVWITIDY
jgi:hypothetical protein